MQPGPCPGHRCAAGLGGREAGGSACGARCDAPGGGGLCRPLSAVGEVGGADQAAQRSQLFGGVGAALGDDDLVVGAETTGEGQELITRISDDLILRAERRTREGQVQTCTATAWRWEVGHRREARRPPAEVPEAWKQGHNCRTRCERKAGLMATIFPSNPAVDINLISLMRQQRPPANKPLRILRPPAPARCHPRVARTAAPAPCCRGGRGRTPPSPMCGSRHPRSAVAGAASNTHRRKVVTQGISRVWTSVVNR